MDIASSKRSKKRIAIIIGTRPEAIKLCPVVLELQNSDWAEPVVIATGQHRELLHESMEALGVTVDRDLAIMTDGQTLASLTAKAISKLDPLLVELEPDLVIAQGDTTSVMVASLCCFYRAIPFGHVEAGLRTHDIHAPFPEEFNRRVAGLATDLHFAPTTKSRRNLELEGVPADQLFLTGNTVIDALHSVHRQSPELPFAIPQDARVILMTAHRRENFGQPMRDLFGAVGDIIDRFPGLEVVYPVHPNPMVQGMANELLGPVKGVHLCEPLGYKQLVSVMARSDIVLTDSGGLQEEAPALGKPVIVTRDVTERPEAVDLGVAKLVGTDRALIVDTVSRLLEDPAAYKSMSKGASPYGDGLASERICKIIEAYFAGTLTQSFADKISFQQPVA